MHHVGENRGLESGGVGVDEEKQGILGQQLCGQFDQGKHVVFNLPDLPFGTAAVGGREDP